MDSSDWRPIHQKTPLALRPLLNLPWLIKRSIVNRPLAWRIFAGICRRIGWDDGCLGWHAAVNGPYAGIRLLATHTNHLWIPMGTYELAVSMWLVRLLADERWGCGEKDVWDVGAHRGYTSLLCAKHGRGRIVAFEPAEENIRDFGIHLRANPDLAARVEIVEAALSDRDDEVTLLIRDAASESQILIDGVQLSDRTATVRTTRVRSVRIDSLLEQGRRGPGLLKIDIEGAEVAALSGATRMLKECRPVIVLEVHNRDSSARSVSLLKEAGYAIRQINGDRLEELIGEPMTYGHVLAVDSAASPWSRTVRRSRRISSSPGSTHVLERS